jgi:PPOX class probable F420-dependent enzyme
MIPTPVAGTAAALGPAVSLLRRPLTAVLTTVANDGRLQVTPVWFALDGGQPAVSTMREFAKARNMRDRPVATLLVVNPADSGDWVEVRARVRLDEDNAGELLDVIGEHYTGRRPYFGAVVPAGLATAEHPVTCRLEPIAVRTPPSVPKPDSRMGPPVASHVVAPDLRAALGCRDDAALPVDHVDLLDTPLVAALATMLPSGVPQTQPVWFTRDDGDLLVNTTLQRRKGRNLLADPRATLLVIDPSDSSRWVEIRADVDLSTAHAEEQLDAMTRAYTRLSHYYGGIYPLAQRALETRVVARLHPRVVHCDAIHR